MTRVFEPAYKGIMWEYINLYNDVIVNEVRTKSSIYYRENFNWLNDACVRRGVRI